MKITTILWCAGVLAIAGAAHAQSLPLPAPTNPVKPSTIEWRLFPPSEPALVAREVRLSELTLQKQDDRTLQMLFTVGSQPLPLTPPQPAPKGQALVTMHVRFVVIPGP